MASIYRINKGVNKPVEFRGLKAQYIWYLGGGIIALMIIYAVMYIIGLNQYICLAVILCLGAGVVMKVYQLSDKYGEHGMMKSMARKSVPKTIKCNSRRVFMDQERKIRIQRSK
ncbi:DUF4133 domain-containing protein [Olivibacter jilunii]|uniref:DUF4133 domain-containing protein n=1 Tax=Olivibacter jilunii TaxID=985016 RepID=UPI00102F47BF|nr:DUF4133 domain-containing protein [Olivibacter jilunii]